MPSRYDDVIAEIAAYACRRGEVGSDEAFNTARLALMDSIGCAFLALGFPACGEFLSSGELYGDSAEYVPVPGTPYFKPASAAAFDITAAIRWLDFNDTWLANEWGHPSDNFGAILAAAHRVSTTGKSRKTSVLTVREVLEMAIRAYEVQGVLALDNAFNRVGIDHVLLVKVASTAIAAALYSDNDEEIVSSAISHAWLDATLRTYRHAPNTMSRKSWAAADAASRGMTFASFAVRGMPGCHSALTAPNYGFQDVWFNGQAVNLQRDFASYVMENILFKVQYPAEFHGQTAVEAAVELHPEVANRMGEISSIEIRTQEPAIRIIDKTGPLNNPADRDHCIQYMTSIALMRGNVTSGDYEDEAARDPRIDTLREKMVITERTDYSREYLDPDLRSIANAVQVRFSDGTSTPEVEVRFPVGHRQRRTEAIPLLKDKFAANLSLTYGASMFAQSVAEIFNDLESIDEIPVVDFMKTLSLKTYDNGGTQ